MSEINSWMALQSAMQADGQVRRPVARETRRRVREFARPHRRTITTFLLLATLSAVIGVATPLLAGQAVNAIVDRESRSTVVVLGLAIALIAVLDAGVGLLERLMSSSLLPLFVLPARRVGARVGHLEREAAEHTPR